MLEGRDRNVILCRSSLMTLCIYLVYVHVQGSFYICMHVGIVVDIQTRCTVGMIPIRTCVMERESVYKSCMGMSEL